MFFSMIAIALLHPILPDKPWLNREQVYLVKQGRGSFYYFAKHILRGNSPIDILILGDSLPEAGFYVPILMDAFEERFGRRPTVEIASYPGKFLEYNYLALSDVLARRPVKLALVQMARESVRTFSLRHYTRNLWSFDLHWPVIRNLDLSDQLSLYLLKSQASLRELLVPFRSNFSEQDIGWCHAEEFGACHFGGNPGWPGAPESDITLTESLHFRGDSKLLVERGKLSRFHASLNAAMIDLCNEKGTALAYYQLPYYVVRAPTATIEVPELPDTKPGRSPLVIGAPLDELFPDYEREEIARKFYKEKTRGLHLMPKSADYVTRKLAPAILEAYALLVENRRSKEPSL